MWPFKCKPHEPSELVRELTEALGSETWEFMSSRSTRDGKYYIASNKNLKLRITYYPGSATALMSIVANKYDYLPTLSPEDERYFMRQLEERRKQFDEDKRIEREKDQSIAESKIIIDLKTYNRK